MHGRHEKDNNTGSVGEEASATKSNSRESRRSLQMSMIADHAMNWGASGEESL